MMDWMILDFLFNLIILSGLIAILIVIWVLILGMIAMFFKE